MTDLIAFQGAPGAYSDLACRSVYPSMATMPCHNFADVFAAVTEGRAKLGMLPIENSIAGRVADIHFLLPESKLTIIGEHYQRVIHHLLVQPGTKIEDVKIAKSHPQALAQCRKFLKAHNITPVEAHDTAGGAELVSKEKNPTIAGIASALAGELYGLESLQADIADEPNNTTRFLIMSREEQRPRPGSFCLTAIIFKARSVPASLYKALGGFATCGVNLTKIESYIANANFGDAMFYVEVEGHPEEKPLQMALEELKFFAKDIRLLGTFPGHAFRRQS